MRSLRSRGSALEALCDNSTLLSNCRHFLWMILCITRRSVPGLQPDMSAHCLRAYFAVRDIDRLRGLRDGGHLGEGAVGQSATWKITG
jgi:hypothetical protein